MSDARAAVSRRASRSARILSLTATGGYGRVVVAGVTVEPRWCAVWAVAALAGALAGCAEPAQPGDTGTADAETTQPSDADAGAPPEVDALEDPDGISLDPCVGVECSGHGTCAVVAGRVTCECDPDYTADLGLVCINTRIVPCLAAAPPDAVSVPAGAEVQFTDLAGWSAPPPCAWQCAAGFARVEDRCVPVAMLPRWCADFCAAQQELCPGGGSAPTDCQAVCAPSVASGADCMSACLASLDEPAVAPQVICGGLTRRLETFRCGQLSGCADPAPADGCEALCDAVADCGQLTDPRLPFGASHGECVLYCEAMATTLSPKGRFEPLRACVLEAMAACDPVHLLACTIESVPRLGTELCTSYSADCGFIPEIWPDAPACEAALASWSGGQRLAVAGCATFLGKYAQCGEHDCANPPAVVPPSAVAAAKELRSACPELFFMPPELAYVDEYYGWLLTGALKASGLPTQVDVAAVSACIQSAPCPTSRDETLLCALNAPEE